MVVQYSSGVKTKEQKLLEKKKVYSHRKKK